MDRFWAWKSGSDSAALREIQFSRMSAEIVKVAGEIVTVRFTGKLTQPDLTELHKQIANIIERQNKVRLLVIAEQFRGWEREGPWGDLSFQVKYDRYIERMAIVCDEKWESLALLFMRKGFRRFPIEYFPLERIESARAWLLSNANSPGHSKNDLAFDVVGRGFQSGT